MGIDPLLQAVSATFAELGVGGALVNRTVLLRDDYFVGYRFRCGDCHATWKPDSTAVEFFGVDGELLRTISVEEPQRRAAA